MKQPYPRDLEALQKIVADTEHFFETRNIDVALRPKVDLAIEELFVNMVTYNTETDHEIEIKMKAINNGIEVSLVDRGVEPFDPTQPRTVDVSSPLVERKPGGLGLFLVLKMVDSIHYEYENRTSTITFRNCIESSRV